MSDYCPHSRSGCETPRFWLRRFAHRLWICDCGAAWRTRKTGSYSGDFWQWERWDDAKEDAS